MREVFAALGVPVFRWRPDGRLWGRPRPYARWMWLFVDEAAQIVRWRQCVAFRDSAPTGAFFGDPGNSIIARQGSHPEVTSVPRRWNNAFWRATDHRCGI